MMKQLRSCARVITLSLSIGVGSMWAQRSYAISGTMVTARGVIENGTMVVADDRIQDIGPEASVPKDVAIIRVDGIVSPGLIDLHNHLVWNVFPRWTLPSPVANRYEWQALSEYA